jgi:hypothetical protein
MKVILKSPYLNDFEIKVTKDAVSWYLRRLVSEEVLEGVVVEIVPRVRGLPKNVDGHVIHNVHLSLKELKFKTQRKFRLIILKKRDFDLLEYLMVLAHECVHIKQALMGELKFLLDTPSETQSIIWRGRVTPFLRDLSHRNFPWEKEAFSKQTTIRDEFLLHYSEILNGGK